MSDSIFTPAKYAELAAQQVLLEAVKAGALPPITSEGAGQHAAQGLIALHEKLTAYYRSLHGDA